MEIKDYIKTLYGKIDSLDETGKRIIDYAKKNNIPFLDPEKAKILSLLIKIKEPEKVLEIGLGSGFSTYNILKSLNGYSKLISVDFNFFRVEYFYESIYKKFSYKEKRKLTVYPLDIFYASEIFLKINEKFDFIFLDSTKRDYYELLPKLYKILNEKGVLLCDNISYCNQMFKPVAKRSKKYLEGIKLMDKFNKNLLSLQNFETVFIPVSDGMSLSIKY